MRATGGTFLNWWLTVIRRFVLDNRLGYVPFDLLEEFSTSLQGPRSPEPLMRVDSAQGLGPCLFEPTLSVPQLSLERRRLAQVIRVIKRIGFGVFDMSLRPVESASIKKQLGQNGMNPMQLIVPVGRGC